jgi:hypothetical protein
MQVDHCVCPNCAFIWQLDGFEDFGAVLHCDLCARTSTWADGTASFTQACLGACSARRNARSATGRIQHEGNG